jgi:hypothetical protein
MPPTIPGTGTFGLKCSGLSTTGGSLVGKYTVSDGMVSMSGGDPSSVTLTADSQSTMTFATADTFGEATTTLSGTPAADDESVVAIKFQTSGWTETATSTFICREGWF